MVEANERPSIICPTTQTHYKILNTLGRGGNAVVKLVEKIPSDGQLYAMKIFEPHPDDKKEFVKKT